MPRFEISYAQYANAATAFNKKVPALEKVSREVNKIHNEIKIICDEIRDQHTRVGKIHWAITGTYSRLKSVLGDYTPNKSDYWDNMIAAELAHPRAKPLSEYPLQRSDLDGIMSPKDIAAAIPYGKSSISPMYLNAKSFVIPDKGLVDDVLISGEEYLLLKEWLVSDE